MKDTERRIAWVEVPTEEQVRADMPASRRHSYDFGFVAGMSRLRSAHRRISGPLRALSSEILFGPGLLSRAEREMIAAVASAAQDCFY